MGDETAMGDQPEKVHGGSVSAAYSWDGPTPLANAF